MLEQFQPVESPLRAIGFCHIETHTEVKMRNKLQVDKD